MREKCMRFSATKKAVLGVFMASIAFVGSAAFVGASTETAKADATAIVKPFALYEFEDEANLGKDTSGNGFDLKTSGSVYSDLEGDDMFLSLDGEGGLYAPAISDGKDYDYQRFVLFNLCLVSYHFNLCCGSFDLFLIRIYTEQGLAMQATLKWQRQARQTGRQN